MKISRTTTRKTCRVCGSGKLEKVFSIGNLYISTFVKNKKEKTPRAPLELVHCKNCDLLQLKHTAPQELLYARHYWYWSGLNPVIVNDLKEIAQVATKAAKLKKGDIVLDIGANDGTMLKYYPKSVIRVGCEPATNLTKYLKKVTPYVIADFWTYKNWRKKFGGKKAKVITAIGMFYDMENPNLFIRDAAKALDKNGIFIAQLMTLKPMIQKNDLGNICVKPDTIILGDNKPIKEYASGDYAIGSNGRLVQALNKIQRSYNGELIKINPMYLEPVTTTPEHPVRIVRKEFLRYDCNQLKPEPGPYKLEWVSAKSVKRGDFIVTPRLASDETIKSLDLTDFNWINKRGYRWGLTSFPINRDTAWLLGLYVAEGHTGGRADNPFFSFTLHQKEKKLLSRITMIAKRLGYRATIIPSKRSQGVEIRIVCAALARALPKWCGKGAPNKQVPDFVMFAPPEIKIAFLRGLFEGDGYIRKNKVHFHSSSKKLILQTQLLVASLGGVLGISYVKPYEREIRGGRVISKDSWQLRGSSKALAKIFGYQHKGPIINHVILENNYILIPVKSVDKESYKGAVHNIETEDETYLVSNAIVHNCHEHLEYYSYPSLVYFFEKNGLEIFKVEENSINGGSYRLFARHLKKGLPAGRQGSIKYKEPKYDYKAFAKRLETNKKKAVDFIKREVKRGKKVYVYGASTKGNTILQYYGLNNKLIKAAADKDEQKWGKYTVGTLIPIIDEDKARKDADYFFVSPWAFFDTFYKREKEWLKNGGKFIVPLPNFRVVGAKR